MTRIVDTVFLTQFEALNINGDRTMEVGSLSGAKYHCRRSFSNTGNHEEKPTISLTGHDFWAVAHGQTAKVVVDPPAHQSEISCTDMVEVRLPTLEEYRVQLARATEWFKANGLFVPSPPTDEFIACLITPLEV